MRYSLPEMVALVRSVGLDGEPGAVAVAIAGWDGAPHPGESGGNPNALGDTTLVDGKWGPSVGLWQVRSLHVERGQQTTRDQDSLADPMFNARSMIAISSNGTNWQPWSIYTKGYYRQNIEAAREAVDGGAGEGVKLSLPEWVPTPGLPDLPNPLGALDPLEAVVGALVSPTFWRRVGLGVAGVVLLAIGVALTFGTTFLDRTPLGMAAEVAR